MLSLIIPTYNERENIHPLVERLHKVLKDVEYSYEIIVVDDDSLDRTWELAQDLTKRYKTLLVIRRTGGRGLATAVVRGWKEARGEILAVMDGDLQHPPEILLSLIEALQKDGVDIAIASRHVSGGGVSDWNIVRRGISWAASLAATWILPGTLATVRDPMSGYFALRRSVIEGCSLSPTGYKILLEVLGRGSYRSVEEVPYIFLERKKGGSKFGFRQCLEFLEHLVRLSWAIGELKRLVKYCVVGISGVFVNMGSLILLTLWGIGYLKAGIVAIETAILTNFLFNEFWSFADFSRRRNSIWARLKRLLKFNLFCIGGAMIHLVVLWLFTEFLGLYYLLSNGIGIATATMWNYGMNANVTWESARATRKVRGGQREEDRKALKRSRDEIANFKTTAQTPTSLSLSRKLYLGSVALWLQIIVVTFVILQVRQRVQTPVADWVTKMIYLFAGLHGE